MESGNRTFIIVISAVVVLMGATLAVVLLSTSPTYVGTGVDDFSGDVGKGNYYEISMDADSISEYQALKNREELIHWIYYGYGVGQLDPLHPKDITVNGVKVTCDSYYYETFVGDSPCLWIYHVNPADHRTYGFEQFIDDELVDSRTLVQTDFDLSLAEDEQAMTKGNRIIYTTDDTVSSTVCPSVTIVMGCTITQTVGDKSVTDVDRWDIDVIEKTVGKESASSVVKEYIKDAGGDRVITEDGKILMRYEYLMPIDYEEFLNYIKASGGSVNHETSVSKTIDTVYGKRNVVEHTVSVFGKINSKYTVDYGENNVIYSISEQNLNGEGAVTITVQSSDMIYEVKEVRQDDPVKITDSVVLLGIVISATSVACAVLIGKFIFKYLVKK